MYAAIYKIVVKHGINEVLKYHGSINLFRTVQTELETHSTLSLGSKPNIHIYKAI